MTIVEALASIENDGIRLGAGDFVDVEALKVAADVLRKAIEGNPVIPGHDDQYNIAEMSYNNGYAKGCEDSKQKWIPVSERLPVEDIRVLLLCKNKAMFVGVHGKYYGGTESRFKICTALNSTKLLNKGRVTHWMPLPEPPKENGYE
jgi:hypothetical protein